MNSKRNKIKNTSASNRDRVRVKEKAIANIKNLFWGSSTKLYVLAFTAWRIFIIRKETFTKELQGLYKTWSTQLQPSILSTWGSIKPLRLTSS